MTFMFYYYSIQY